MPEYIEREALIKRLEVSPLLKPAFSFGENLRSGIIDLVKKQLTADVAEVVRCKDCIHRGKESCSMFYECNCGEQHTWETDNDFCSCGERRE